MARQRKSVLGAVIGLSLGSYLAIHAFGSSSGNTSGNLPGSSSSFQACVITRESGGNAQVWNKQGYPYWGLYQFGKPLWDAYGGSPSQWGNASAAEQTQVFDAVMSHYDGCQNWYPSDGCADPSNGCG
jgi:hypothetical protein